MDRMTTVSAALFLAADVFAIVSLAMPDWIVTDVGGKHARTHTLKHTRNPAYAMPIPSVPGETRLGLMWTCITLYNRPQDCFSPELQPEWLLALICIFVGCICVTTTVILLASSNWDRDVIPYARWVGFTASECIYQLQCISLIR